MPNGCKSNSSVGKIGFFYRKNQKIRDLDFWKWESWSLLKEMKFHWFQFFKTQTAIEPITIGLSLSNDSFSRRSQIICTEIATQKIKNKWRSNFLCETGDDELHVCMTQRLFSLPHSHWATALLLGLIWLLLYVRFHFVEQKHNFEWKFLILKYVLWCLLVKFRKRTAKVDRLTIPIFHDNLPSLLICFNLTKIGLQERKWIKYQASCAFQNKQFFCSLLEILLEENTEEWRSVFWDRQLMRNLSMQWYTVISILSLNKGIGPNTIPDNSGLVSE